MITAQNACSKCSLACTASSKFLLKCVYDVHGFGLIWDYSKQLLLEPGPISSKSISELCLQKCQKQAHGTPAARPRGSFEAQHGCAEPWGGRGGRPQGQGSKERTTGKNM